MRILKTIAAAAVVVAFATPAFADCTGASHDKTAQTSKPTTTAEAPQTPRPTGDGGS